MSLVLAFGLSPLGQVKAYAANDKGEQPAAEEVLSTQALPSSLNDALKVNATTITYKGSEWVKPAVGSTPAVDDIADAKIVVYETTNNTQIELKDLNDTGNVYIASYSYKDSSGQAVTTIKNAGTYTLVIKGKGIYADQTLEKQFTVSAYDFSNATVAGHTVGNLPYTGKAQPANLSIASMTVTDKTDPTTYTFSSANNNAVMLTDLNITPPTVKAVGTYPITISGKDGGNFSGSFSGSQVVTTNQFVTTNLQVCGTTFATATNNAMTATKNPTVASPDPAATGNVKYGDDVLTKDTDYTVKYYGASETVANIFSGSATALTEMPTAKGTGYKALITVTNNNANLLYNNDAAKDSVVLTYDIEAAALSDQVKSVEIGSATYVASTGVAVPSSVKFFDADGKDISSTIGSSYTLGAVDAWTEPLEQELLGDAYSAKYPYADAPYTNTTGAAAISNQNPTTFTKNDGTTVTGYAGLPAGDYKLTITGGGSSTGTVYGKFTVDAADPVEGSSVGQLKIVAQTVPYTGAIVTPSAFDVKMVLDTTTGTSATAPQYSAAITPTKVEFLQSGEVVNPKALGTYDVRFTFDDNFGKKTLTKSAGLAVEQADISDYVYAEDSSFTTGISAVNIVTTGKKYMYTGSAVEPELQFMDKTSSTAVDSTAGVDEDDYTVSYKCVSGGSLDSSGKPVGVGTYQVTVNGAGKYKGSIITSTDFTIAKLRLSDAAYTTVQFADKGSTNWTDNYRVAYGSSYQSPDVRLVVAGTETKESPVVIPSSLYDLDVPAATSAQQTLTVTFTGTDENLVDMGNDGNSSDPTYYNKRTGTFYTAKNSFAGATATMALVADEGEYDGTATKHNANVVPTVTVNGTALVAQKVSGSADGTGQYKWEVRNAKGAVVLNSDGTVTTGVIQGGTYTVVVSGGETLEYGGELSKPYTVTPKTIKASDSKLAITLNYNAKSTSTASANDVLVYTGKELDGIASIAYDSTPFTEIGDETSVGNDYTITGGKQTDADTYTASIEFSGNYTGTVTQKFTIKPIQIDATGTTYSVYTAKGAAINTYSAYYDGTEQQPEVAIYNGTTKVDDITFRTEYSNNVNAAKFNAATGPKPTVTVIATGNYSGRLDGYFTIEGYDIASDRVAVNWDNDDLGYTGSAVEPKGTITYTRPDDTVYTLVHGTDYNIEYSGDNVNVGGTAIAKIYGTSPNFVEGSKTYIEKTFSVQQATQTITASATSVKPVYKKSSTVTIEGAKGEITAAPSNGTGSVTATVSGNKVTIKGTKAGTASVKISAAATEDGNYAASNVVVVDVTVAKAANTLKIANAAKTVKYAKLKKAAQKIAGVKVSTKGQGTMTYKVTKVTKGKKSVAKSNFKIAKASANKLTVKKGLAKGTYKVTMTAKAKGNANYSASKVLKKVVTVTVK